jgi:hypothetical protein
VRWYAWAAGCTASPDDQASRTPSLNWPAVSVLWAVSQGYAWRNLG